MKIVHLVLLTFSVVIDSGGRLWAITHTSISLELLDVKRKEVAFSPMLAIFFCQRCNIEEIRCQNPPKHVFSCNKLEVLVAVEASSVMHPTRCKLVKKWAICEIEIRSIFVSQVYLLQIKKLLDHIKQF